MKIQTYHWHAWWTFYRQAGSKKMPTGHLLIMPHAPLGGYSSQSISKWKNMRSSHQKQGFLEICFILVLACLILLQSKKTTDTANKHFKHVFFLSSKNKHDSIRLYFLFETSYPPKKLGWQWPSNHTVNILQWLSFKPRKSCQFFFTTQVTMFTPNLGTEWTA